MKTEYDILKNENPTSWDIMRGDWVLDLHRNTISISDIDSDLVYHFSIPNIQEYNEGQIENVEDISSDKFLLKGGELLYSKLNPRKKTSVIVNCRYDLPIISSTEFLVLSSKNHNLIFLYYLFLSEYYNQRTCSCVKSVTRSHQRINPDDLFKNWFIIPPLEIQKQIADFLDKETTRIDTLISKKQKQIELLQEKRQAIITQAVTKGLNPDVKMKDSGVEWIGEIPEHWSIQRVKHLSSLIKDGTHVTPEYVDNGIPFLRVKDIQTSEIEFDELMYISQEEYQEMFKTNKPQRGDLLLSKNGTIGITKVVDWDWDFGYFVSIAIIRFDWKKINPNYFSFYFHSSIVDHQLKNSMKQTSVINLHLDKISELKIIVPPVDEQDEILDRIGSEVKGIGRIQSKINLSIELLKEYRSSLITHAVSGQIDINKYGVSK